MTDSPSITCPRCRHGNPARAKFCLECGQRLAAACPACGAELPDGARFCMECGRPASGPPATPAVGVSPAPVPAAYTPRHLAERILTSRAALAGERKAVTVLFCDLVGSTTLAERLGAEGMHALINRFFETALAEVHRYEGTVNQFLGDGFMALFGAPLAHEDHARRAALAALAIARALQERPAGEAPDAAIPLTVRMGLHTGFVVVGAIGDNLRMDYTAVGDTTHLAARLQQMAEPGTILASEATWRPVEGYVRGERVGPVAVRGRSEPVVVFRLLGVGSRRSPLEGIGPRGLSQFVGRDRQLDTMLDLFAAVAEGRGQALGIVGEPGVGKSRLLLEFSHRVADRRVTYLRGRCLSYGVTIPYLPVADVVRAACGLVDADTPESTTEKLRFGLQELGMDPEASGPYLLRMLGLKDPSGRLESLGPEVVKARTFETLRQMSLRASRNQPLVLEIEDLHWADRTSEEYFAFLAEILLGAAIFLVATYRPGYRPPWSDRSFATQVSLGRLDADESFAIVRSLLPVSAERNAQAELILAKAEGNPFFLEELTRAVSDQGLGGDLPIPDTVHGVLTARIDRLDEDAKRVLQTASILGREFTVPLLAAIWDDASPVELPLRQLARLEFLFERTAGDEVVYVFKHALTQDVAEATLLPSRRRELHRRAGEARERLNPDRLPELAPRLAHHYVEAEAWAPAAEHTRRAAEAARAIFANQEALARYDQAIHAAQRAALPPAARLVLHEGRGDVHAVQGDFERALADYEAALGLARESRGALDEARILGALASLWGGHKDYERGLALSREAVAAAEGAPEGPESRRVAAEGRLRVGLMELNLARLSSSRPELERALERFRQAGDEGGEGRALDALAMVAALGGHLDAAVAHAHAALPRLAAAGDRQTEASSMFTIAFALHYRGRRAEGQEWMEKALTAAHAIGARALEAYAHSITGELVEPFGDWGLALQEAGAGLALARALGHREWTAMALGALGRVHRSCGDVAGARRFHEEMLGIAQDLRATIWIAEAMGDVGQDRVTEGDAAGARQLADAVRLAGDAIEFGVRALLAVADFALGQGRARDALEAARHLQRDCAQFVVFSADARRVEGDALAVLGQTVEAEALLRRATAEAAALGALPVGWRASLALARLLETTGRADEGRAARADARRLLDKVAVGLTGAPELLRGFEASPAYREAGAR
jgi:class 3 adenylate cyclase/tetratricopeptide (TPR) repeat protein